MHHTGHLALSVGNLHSVEFPVCFIGDFFPSVFSVLVLQNPYHSDVGPPALDFHLSFFFSYLQFLCLFVIFKRFYLLDLPTFWLVIFISTIISFLLNLWMFSVGILFFFFQFRHVIIFSYLSEDNVFLKNFLHRLCVLQVAFILFGLVSLPCSRLSPDVRYSLALRSMKN